MENTIKFINEKTNNFVPETGIVLGSGLGELADEFCDISINYSDIPNFVKSSVKGHKGRLVFADINGKKVVMMQGRNHFYEGYTMKEITYPVKVMKKLGVKTIILTNAAGAFVAGDPPDCSFPFSQPLVAASKSTIAAPIYLALFKVDINLIPIFLLRLC